MIMQLEWHDYNIQSMLNSTAFTFVYIVSSILTLLHVYQATSPWQKDTTEHVTYFI